MRRRPLIAYSLVHRIDDIEDNSKLRRGVPVAHHIFGVASTINCANYVYFESLDMLYKLHNPAAIGVFVGESRMYVLQQYAH